ncbi:mycoredoxin [Corynebacterium zhongnanshanii]|uniref:mycoredoxin n=1 Tax=Corynebacterium zhongnanshanii TaxID=2768834 RepID=UPI001865720C|nr:mycoredoxin [Corynebacterium zhongnanshanii]
MAATDITDKVTVYYADWCPYCKKLITDLNANNIPHTLIDADNGPHAAEDSEWVKSVNNGNRVVPTVRFSDGTHMTNPPVADVAAKFEELS